MKAKFILASAALFATVLFTAPAYAESATKDGVVNVDGLSSKCVMRAVVDNIVLICPVKDKELLAKLVEDNKE